MWGAIIGDIVGSKYEWHNIKTKDFPFFSRRGRFTDDTVMTVAVAEALMNGGAAENFVESMQKFGKMYPRAGYGGNFKRWIHASNPQPYNSWGNGSAMRVSPVGFFYEPTDDLEGDLIRVNKAAAISAEVTHNHPEGINGACSTADAIMIIRSMRRDGADTETIKSKVKEYISGKYSYNLDKTLDEIRPDYSFDVSCMGTIPVAFIAFLESADFEDAIRNAISVGGDSDTLGAITGSLAEAAYDIPEDMIKMTKEYLTPELLSVIEKWDLR